MWIRATLLIFSVSVCNAIFFPSLGGGGGGGCCCSCGTPQPAYCGCQSSCPPVPSCPVCPQPQPCCGGGGGCTGGGCGGGCSGGGCGGYGGGCSGGGCGGGGYVTAGGSYPTAGGYASSGGGGYATSGGAGYATPGGYAGGYSSSSGGGGYQAPQVAQIPVQTAEYSNPSANVAPAPASYGTGSGGYQQNVEAAALDDASAGKRAELSETSTAPPERSAPDLNQAFRSPQICEPKIKYVVLRSKKTGGSPIDEVEEEVEELKDATRHPPVEATASPVEAKDIGDDITRNEALTTGIEDELNEFQAHAATTFTDSKCNSRALKSLIIENVVPSDALATKRQIHEASMKRFSDFTVDVICSGTGFTYLVSTTEHCEAQRDNVICFVYKRPL